jgi:hypothetical protein
MEVIDDDGLSIAVGTDAGDFDRATVGDGDAICSEVGEQAGRVVVHVELTVAQFPQRVGNRLVQLREKCLVNKDILSFMLPVVVPRRPLHDVRQLTPNWADNYSIADSNSGTTIPTWSRFGFNNWQAKSVPSRSTAQGFRTWCSPCQQY